MKSSRIVAVVAALLLIPVVGSGDPTSPDNWPSFRVPGAAGVSAATGLPSDWDVESGRNIAWSLELPGVSHSSPVVWGDQVLVISAVSDSSATKRGITRSRAPVSQPASSGLLRLR